MKRKRFLCLVGWHRWVILDKWTPSITADVVTEFEQKVVCACCGKVKFHVRLVWDGQEMKVAS